MNQSPASPVHRQWFAPAHRRVTVMRVAGLLYLAVAVWVIIISIPNRLDTARLLDAGESGNTELLRAGLAKLGIPVGVYTGAGFAVEVAASAIFLLVGCAIFWRMPTERMAVYSAYMLVGVATDVWNTGATSELYPFWGWVGDFIAITSWTCLFSFGWLFPTGRFVPRWTWVLVIPAAAMVTLDRLFSNAPFNPANWPVVGAVVGIALLGSLVAAQIYRYRNVSTPLQRQQTKWVVASIAAAWAIIVWVYEVADRLLHYNRSATLQVLATFVLGVLITLAFCLFPVLLAVAIARYRLWEIDAIISRALTYSLLTVCLVACYAGAVLLLSVVLSPLVEGSSLTVAGSTLLVAALFQPARRRLQRAVDRHFYRRRYDAARMLEIFSGRMRDEPGLTTLTDELERVVRETMQPSHISVWIRPTRR